MIAVSRLVDILSEDDGLDTGVIERLSGGFDADAHVYRVVAQNGVPWCVKMSGRPLLAPRYSVPRYLSDAGVASVVAPARTRPGALRKTEGGTVVTVWPLVAGISGYRPLTSGEWRRVGMAARAIHDCVMPPDGWPGLPAEAFGVAAYRATSAEVTAHVQAVGVRDETEEMVHAAWREHADRAGAALDAMDRLAHRLQTRELSYVLCHADLHPGNVITAEDGTIAIIDWDEVMAAPRERDFLFVPPDDAAFWEG